MLVYTYREKKKKSANANPQAHWGPLCEKCPCEMESKAGEKQQQ